MLSMSELVIAERAIMASFFSLNNSMEFAGLRGLRCGAARLDRLDWVL